MSHYIYENLLPLWSWGCRLKFSPDYDKKNLVHCDGDDLRLDDVKYVGEGHKCLEFLERFDDYNFAIVVKPIFAGYLDYRFYIVDYTIGEIPSYLPVSGLVDIKMDRSDYLFYIRTENTDKFSIADPNTRKIIGQKINEFDLPSNLETVASTRPDFIEKMPDIIKRRNIMTIQDARKLEWDKKWARYQIETVSKDINRFPEIIPESVNELTKNQQFVKKFMMALQAYGK